MRNIRTLLGTAITVGVVLFAAVAPASATTPPSLSVATTGITNNGLSVNVTLNIVCDPSLNVAFGDAGVSQVSGHKVAQGTGSFVNNFPGVPCTGSTQTVALSVPTGTSFAFKQGSASVSADVTLFDPVSGNLTGFSSAPQDVRLTK
jgi:hypothetical protein